MTLSHGEMEPPIFGVYCSMLPKRVRKMLGFVQSTLKWRLMDRKPLDKWVHDSGPVILLGDACHPMLVRYTVGSLSSLIVDVRRSHTERKVLRWQSKMEPYLAIFYREFPIPPN